MANFCIFFKFGGFGGRNLPKIFFICDGRILHISSSLEGSEGHFSERQVFRERQERRGVLFTLKHRGTLKGGDVITVAATENLSRKASSGLITAQFYRKLKLFERRRQRIHVFG